MSDPRIEKVIRELVRFGYPRPPIKTVKSILSILDNETKATDEVLPNWELVHAVRGGALNALRHAGVSEDELTERLTAFLAQYSHVHESSTLMPGLMLGDLRAAVEALTRSNDEPTEDMIEHVALAIAKEIVWGAFSHFNPDDMRRVSRAAINAMRSDE